MTVIPRTYNIGSPTLARHASRVAVFLFIFVYLGIVLWLVLSPRLLPLLPPFAEFVIQHRSPIRVLTAILAFLCASFFFWPKEGAQLVGRWNNFVGLAFATFFVQYLLRYLDLKSKGMIGSSAIHFVTEIVVYLCSGLNNLLFLGAARILLNKNKNVPDIKSPSTVSKLAQLKEKLLRLLAEFRAAVPTWAILIALFSPFAILDTKSSLIWARFPDALFSFYCLVWFGYATAINFNVRRRVFLAGLALVISFSYGAAQIVYAFNPIIAYTAPPNKATVFPLSWVRQAIGTKVNALVVESNKKAGRDVTPKEFLDGAVYAVLFPMKFALFLPPFSLYLLFIISVNDFRGTLSESATRRKDYLSSDGIVRAIGHSVGADKVSLFIRIPGVQKIHHVHEDRVLPLVWHRAKSGRSDKKLEEIFPVKADPFLLKMLKEQDSEMSVISANGNRSQNGGRFIGIPSNVELTVPIKFHGGVIGILQVNLRGYARFNHTTLQKLRLLADLVAPSVQSFRALAAVDQIGFRLARLQVSLRFGSLEMATQSVLRILHDVLSPLGTGLFLEMGFVSTKEVLSHSSALMRRLEDQAVSSETNTDVSHTISVEGEDITLVTCPMFIRTMEVVREDEAAKGPLLGTLRFVIPTEKDQFSRPTLAAYYLNRKTAASLTADGILDLTRDFFSSIIKDLGVSFSRDTLTREAWFASIVVAINKAGLLWVVAVAHEGEETESAIQLVSELDDMQQANLRKQILSTIANPRDIVLRNAIRLNLGRSKHELWIGLERDGFGRELTFESPWKVFLNDLRDMSDTALDTLEKRQVAEVEKLRTAQYQGVMTIAVTTGTLMHQLVNMIKDQLFATESLEEALAEKKLQLDRADATLLTAMKRSAGQMRVLTEAFKSVTKMEERRPCSLREAAEQAMKLFQVALIQRKIETRISISPQIIADVPFHVAAFALANLIGNAKEAIKANGRIDIEAEEDGKFVLCHVTNSGPQISEADRKHLFQFGKSTKPGHNGWGLYFVSRSLQENGGAINVDEANPETRFTIRLPKPDHE